jgi:hypothetical protein
VNTDQLIERLVADVRPVRRLLDPTERAALWMAVALVSIAGGVAYFGVRRDIATIWFDVEFVGRGLLLVATMWLAVVSAFRMAVPGAERRAFARWWPIAALGVVLAVLAAEVIAAAIMGNAGSPLRAVHCIQKVALVGVVPAVVAVVLVRRAWAAEPKWTLVLGMLGSGAAGALTAELSCPIHAPLHILLWHMLPVVGVAALGVVLGNALIRRAVGRP